MNNKKYDAIGVAEVTFYANAVYILDEMLKAADVAFVAAEKLLGGRLVTLLVAGSTSEVDAAIETAKSVSDRLGDSPLKMGVTISNPHQEILKFIPKGNGVQ